MKKLFARLAFAAVLGSLLLSIQPTFAQGTAFTYQGQLQNNGSPANGLYDFEFTLYPNAAGTGPLLGTGTITQTALGVTNGLFTTTMDFGPGIFTGNAVWLAISVRSNGVGNYIGLTPLQPLTPTPYATFANTASNVSGTITLAQLPSGLVTNNEAGVTLTNLTVGGSLNLPATSPTINSGGTLLMRADSLFDFYAGPGAGNLTNTFGYNTAVGYQALHSLTSGYQNTAIGYEALMNNPVGSYNVAVGFNAMVNSSTTGGNGSTAIGYEALMNASGGPNTAIGYQALNTDSTGGANTAIGWQAMAANGAGSENTATGEGGPTSNTTGNGNTANGQLALADTSSGSFNTASGASALNLNQTGSNNTASGYSALYNNKASYNTANGYQALYTDTVGSNNTANGYQALNLNISGNFNTADGVQALYSLLTGSNNIALGSLAGYNLTLGSSNIFIGNQGGSGDNNTIRIGTSQSQTFIAGVINGNGSGLTNLSLAQLPAGVVTNNEPLVGLGSLILNNGLLMGGNLNFLSAAPSIYAGSTRLLYSDTNNNSTFGLAAGNGGGNNNTAIGAGALSGNATGINNVATGNGALQNNTASENTADGGYALQNLQAGNNNIGIGYNGGNNLTSGSNNIYIGNAGHTSESGVIRIGLAGVQTQTSIAGTAVGINMSNPTASLDVNGEFMVIEGLGGVRGYLGDEGVSNVVQIGSLTPGVTSVVCFNVADNSNMNLTCSSVSITGGSDLAEPFPISKADRQVSEGMVVVIDKQNPGHLKMSDQPYDPRVAGVVSGANGINPGIQMQQQGLLAGGRNVALTGRVYVQADTTNGAIEPGDMLTTSSTPGRAMKVSDHVKAQGAILGKAMTGLNEGQGMVLVLVTLQ